MSLGKDFQWELGEPASTLQSHLVWSSVTRRSQGVLDIASLAKRGTPARGKEEEFWGSHGETEGRLASETSGE